MLARVSFKGEHVDPCNINMFAAQKIQWQDTSLRRISRTHRQDFALQIFQVVNCPVTADDHLGLKITITISHAEGERFSAGPFLHSYMSQRSIPGDVNVSL